MNRDEMIVAAIAYEAAHYADQNDMRFSSEVLADFAIQQIATERKAIAAELRDISAQSEKLAAFLSMHGNPIQKLIAKLEKENE